MYILKDPWRFVKGSLGFVRPVIGYSFTTFYCVMLLRQWNALSTQAACSATFQPSRHGEEKLQLLSFKL